MSWVWQAIGLFAATNVDDLIVLALFFARARAAGVGSAGIVVGQYLGFAAILVLCVAGAVGAGRLPAHDLGYLGLIPILLGLWLGWFGWRGRRSGDDGERPPAGTSWWAVAGVTVANSGDNVGVYVPAFAGRPAISLAGFVLAFLVLVGVWCLAGRLLTTHPAVVAAVRRWGEVVTPIALIAIGVIVLLAH